LAKEKQEKEVCNFFRLQVYRTKWLCAQKLSTDLALEKARADTWKTELDSAQEMIDIHQMSW
jgi:hypothetical protein